MKRAFVWLLIAAVVGTGVAFLTVFPTRTYLGQRRDLAAAEERTRLLGRQNQQLAARVRKLNTDGEIERLAREQYSLVKPGEEAYAILPPATTTSTAPARVEPLRHRRSTFWSRTIDRVVFWD